MSKGVSILNLLVVIFGLVAIFAIAGTFQGLKEKNILAIVFNVVAVLIFGWFSIMTVINQGYPPALH